MKENKKALKTAVKEGLLSTDKKSNLFFENFKLFFNLRGRNYFTHKKTREIGYDKETLEAATEE